MEEFKQIFTRHRRRIIKLAIFLVPTLSAASMAVMAAGDLKSYYHEPSIKPIDPALIAQAQSQNSSDPSSRAVLPIFGDFRSEQEAAKVNKDKLPTTSLNLTLHAIFFSTDPKAGSALISKQGRKKAQLYNVGSPIMRGVRLEQVRISSVVIDRNGSSESLRLPRLGKEKI